MLSIISSNRHIDGKKVVLELNFPFSVLAKTLNGIGGEAGDGHVPHTGTVQIDGDLVTVSFYITFEKAIIQFMNETPFYDYEPFGW